jgi:hypothetical protein
MRVKSISQQHDAHVKDPGVPDPLQCVVCPSRRRAWHVRSRCLSKSAPCTLPASRPSRKRMAWLRQQSALGWSYKTLQLQGVSNLAFASSRIPTDPTITTHNLWSHQHETSQTIDVLHSRHPLEMLYLLRGRQELNKISGIAMED